MNTSNNSRAPEDGLIDSSPNKRTLSLTSTEHLLSACYQVEDFGFLVLTSAEQYPDTWYPTPSDLMPAGWFTLEVDNACFGDFNGDGLQDLVVHPFLFMHVVPRETRIDPVFLFQQLDGTFANPQVVINEAQFPEKFFEYRMGVGDFNGDGVDDVSISTMGMPQSADAKDVASRKFLAESPLTIYGNSNALTWTDSYEGLSLSQGAPNWQIGYNTGHSMAVGDFNGDGLSDWFSDGYVAISHGDTFVAERYVPNSNAVKKLVPWDNEWTWPTVNACVSSDFNEDGFDDLIYSGMPRVDRGEYNGGDLYLLLGSSAGLKDGIDSISLPRTNTLTDNVGTNFIVAADFNGDNHRDLIFVEHGWVSDAGDSSNYYSQAKFRFLLGDGKGGFIENAVGIVDPYSGIRQGEGNLFATDINGDGWIDLVASGYYNKAPLAGNTSINSTSIFLNKNGLLEYVPEYELAYVEPHQFSGEESIKEWTQTGLGKLYPVDIGEDGLVDFVGFVQTPLHQWPQVEQRYTYAYISRATSPLGRVDGEENLGGTAGSDKIYGYKDNDILAGLNGNDFLDGGEGIDIAKYRGSSFQYQINLETSTVVDGQSNRDGSDTLKNVERLKFPDANIALDVAKGEIAGEAYRIYKAAFDRTPDQEGLGYWINAMDHGASLINVASGFISSPEFQKLYGSNVSDRDYVTKLYNNVLDRNPDQEGYDFWLGALVNGASREDVLVNFSESKENIANVADLIVNGIQYQEWVG